jgi:hypothetical protein
MRWLTGDEAPCIAEPWRTERLTNVTGPKEPDEPGGPLIAIVSSADIAREQTLNATYWTTRNPGETYVAWQRRREAEELERRADRHNQHAATLRETAAELRGLGQPGDPLAAYEAVLAEIARMKTDVRAAETRALELRSIVASHPLVGEAAVLDAEARHTGGQP